MYGCIAEIMDAHPDHAGYLSFHFDLVLNYWTFDKFDKNKTWITHTVDNEGPYSLTLYPNDSTLPSTLINPS